MKAIALNKLTAKRKVKCFETTQLLIAETVGSKRGERHDNNKTTEINKKRVNHFDR